MKFVLFHGAFGSPEGNWLPELKDKLESLGQEVVAPKFPVDNWDEITKNGPKKPAQNQSLASWMKVFEKVKDQFKPGEELCFVGHSLGPLFILHCVEKFNLKLDSAIFVSPFLDKLNRSWQIDHVNKSFYKTDFEFAQLKQLIPISYVLYSDDDPYVDKRHSLLFAHALESSPIFVRRAGHMNNEVNLNDFPLVLDLCISRLNLSLYQRYLALRDKLGLINYVRTTKSSSIKLNLEEALAEGVFRFRNLEKGGFFTLFTKMLKYWDPRSLYMSDARNASRKGKKLTRVVIVDKMADFKNPSLKEQILLDFEAGIQVYLCRYAEIKDQVAVPDFGITDDSYVCLVPYNENIEKVGEVELNSTSEVMKKALKWKEIILQKAVKITNPDKDITAFIKSKS